jgi:hypothetical protein
MHMYFDYDSDLEGRASARPYKNKHGFRKMSPGA